LPEISGDAAKRAFGSNYPGDRIDGALTPDPQASSRAPRAGLGRLQAAGNAGDVVADAAAQSASAAGGVGQRLTIEMVQVDEACETVGCKQRAPLDIISESEAPRPVDEPPAVAATMSAGLQHRIVESLAFGIVEIDPGWRVMYANRAAQALLAEDKALSIEAGVLALRPVAMQVRARQWLAEPASAGALPLAVARADGRPPILLERLSRLTDEAGSAAHVLALLNTARPLAVDAERLVAAFGLTRAEARLTAALAAGETLQEFARRQNVAVATVRTHLERVLAKTGARRQTQVVRLAMACVAPLSLLKCQQRGGQVEVNGANHSSNAGAERETAGGVSQARSGDFSCCWHDVPLDAHQPRRVAHLATGKVRRTRGGGIDPRRRQ
jgi:DNA-binding CsgD family transcriptional regulator